MKAFRILINKGLNYYDFISLGNSWEQVAKKVYRKYNNIPEKNIEIKELGVIQKI